MLNQSNDLNINPNVSTYRLIKINLIMEIGEAGITESLLLDLKL